MKVVNGYVIISSNDCKKLEKSKFDFSDENNYAIGVHNNCDVLFTRSGENFRDLRKSSSEKVDHLRKSEDNEDDLPERLNIANHVYAASFNFNGDVVCNDFTLKIAKNLLMAEYKATILADRENSYRMEADNRKGAKKLFLTLLGGGVFRNPLSMIAEAILSCKKVIEESGLDIYIVCFDSYSFSQIEPILSPFVKKTKGEIIKLKKLS